MIIATFIELVKVKQLFKYTVWSIGLKPNKTRPWNLSKRCWRPFGNCGLKIKLQYPKAIEQTKYSYKKNFTLEFPLLLLYT